jgi:MraZ protein
VFRGKFNHNVDAKGRLNFPAKFREVLANNYEERVVLAKHDRCLRGYPLSEWKAFEKAKDKVYRTKEQENILRFFLASCADCGFDKQGRILIPQELRDYAGVTKEVVLVGMLSRFEIWDRERWESEIVKTLEAEDIGDALAQLGL